MCVLCLCRTEQGLLRLWKWMVMISVSVSVKCPAVNTQTHTLMLTVFLLPVRALAHKQLRFVSCGMRNADKMTGCINYYGLRRLGCWLTPSKARTCVTEPSPGTCIEGNLFIPDENQVFMNGSWVSAFSLRAAGHFVRLLYPVCVFLTQIHLI